MLSDGLERHVNVYQIISALSLTELLSESMEYQWDGMKDNDRRSLLCMEWLVMFGVIVMFITARALSHIHLFCSQGIDCLR